MLLSYLAIGIIATLLRVLDLGLFLTGDEANFWIRRSYVFLDALRTRNYAATAVSTHPGVTTMWLGSAGVLLLDYVSDHGWLTNYQTTMTLGILRLPAALMHVMGILLSYALLRRMLPAMVAVLAALLWATDPFMLGYSRVLHVDALAATFATPSLLAACLYWHHTRRAGWLVLSAVCAGLAIMSKSPALLLAPTVSSIALLAAWRPPRQVGWLKSAMVTTVVWGVICGITMALLWPAVWANPAEVVEQLRIGVEVEGAQPHQLGNFYMGQAVETPGWTFYAVALVMRLTPWTLLGLLLLPLAWWRWRDLHPARRDLIVLAGYVLVFVIAMSFFAKKFNRYLIPAWPPLDILAAVGLVWGAMGIGALAQRLFHGTERLARRTANALLAGLALLAVVHAFWWYPYSITYFNEVFGGARAGNRVFLIGWGEGFNLVADWLNEQPNITGVTTISRMIEVLNPYLKEGAQASPARGPDPLKDAGYIVVYVRSVQGTLPSPPFDQFYQQAIPAHIVRIHGVEYAWIYEVPPQLDQTVGADFGPAIHLRGFDRVHTPARGQSLDFQLLWETRELPGRDFWLFAHLVGPDGQRYDQVDLPYPTSTWTPGRFVRTNVPLTLPAAAPPGMYQVIIGLYDPDTYARLPLTAEQMADPALAGGDALVLDRFEVE